MNAMPLTVGNLRPEDDYMHRVTDDPSFNESMFFNFFDASQNLGGFVRIGNRVNERHAEMTLCVFLPTGELLMQWGKPEISSNDSLDAAGMSFRVLEPGRRFAVRYEGSAVRIADPYEMRDPGKAMRGNPQCQVRLALDVTSTGPMIGDAEGNTTSIIFLDGVGHYQQPIASIGTLQAGPDHWTVDGLGVRDHSWGRRDWQSIYRDRSLWLSLGPELTVIACKTWLSPDCVPDTMGCLIEQGRVTRLKRIDMFSRFRRGTYYHDAVRLDVEDVDGRRISFDGRVLAYVPLRHRREGHETVYLGQAMTRFRMGDREILGLSEYFDAASATASLVDASNREVIIAE